jgi:hypothetical protein
VIDPRFALTNQPPELAGDTDHERSAPDTDGQKPTEERHRISSAVEDFTSPTLPEAH